MTQTKCRGMQLSNGHNSTKKPNECLICPFVYTIPIIPNEPAVSHHLLLGCGNTPAALKVR